MKTPSKYIWLLFLQAAALICIADRAPMYLQSKYPDVNIGGDFSKYVTEVNERIATGPYVYRVMVPCFVRAIHLAIPVVSELNADTLLKVLALLLCQGLFYAYLKIYFSDQWSLCGVLLLDCLVGYTLAYIPGPSAVETMDLINLVFFTAGLILLQNRQYLAFAVLGCLSILNRETLLVLLPLVVWMGYRETKRTLAVLPALIAMPSVYLGVRLGFKYLLPPSPSPSVGFDWFTFDGRFWNFPAFAGGITVHAIASNLHVAILVGPLLILALMGLKRREQFLRDAMIVVPLFIVIHYAVGTVIESRLWSPLFPILIAPAFKTLDELVAKEKGYATVEK